eukprot:gene8612-6203_t
MSTKMSTDMNITRPTSRVLRPPGGGSSNIFGTNEPAPAPSRPAAQRAVEPTPAPVSKPVPVASAPQPVAEPVRAPTGRRQPPGGQSSIVFG